MAQGKNLKEGNITVTVNETSSFTTSVVLGGEIDDNGTMRDGIIIHISGSDYASVHSAFSELETLVVSDGTESYDYSDCQVLCRITVNFGGDILVFMGKKTREEFLEEENAALLYESLTGEAFA